jgi:hypothetical protein
MHPKRKWPFELPLGGHFLLLAKTSFPTRPLFPEETPRKARRIDPALRHCYAAA